MVNLNTGNVAAAFVFLSHKGSIALMGSVQQEMQIFFESEKGPREHTGWKAKREAEQQKRYDKGGNILSDAPAFHLSAEV